MRSLISWSFFAFTLVITSFAYAQLSNTALDAVLKDDVEVTTTQGTERGTLIRYTDDTLVLLDSDQSVIEIPREDVQKLRLPSASSASKSEKPAPNPVRPSQDARAEAEAPATVAASSPVSHTDQQRALRREFEQQRRSVERTGAAYRIPGGVLTGLGSLIAFSSLTSLAVTGTHESYYYAGYEEKSRESLRSGAVTSAVVGAGIAAAGVGLIVAGNKKRRRAREAYDNAFSTSVQPMIQAGGGGATLHLQF